ncbi:hypothetical protein [Inoviridae sp.]|nr:hypothetical protein [Inoviridae sp.]UOF79001.1 hypothetical protein [Inoviridae sp.]UOF81655.1 hypothetical protein [Inoviridae sp.]
MRHSSTAFGLLRYATQSHGVVLRPPCDPTRGFASRFRSTCGGFKRRAEFLRL